jgi:hypothetical protein
MLQTMKQKKLMDSDNSESSFDIFGPICFQNNIIVRAKLAEIVLMIKKN